MLAIRPAEPVSASPVVGGCNQFAKLRREAFPLSSYRGPVFLPEAARAKTIAIAELSSEIFKTMHPFSHLGGDRKLLPSLEEFEGESSQADGLDRGVFMRGYL